MSITLILTGEAARRAGVHPDTVRTYCERGFLDPLRDSSGRRLFTESDVKCIRKVFLENQAKYPVLVGV
jgi:DNA-binding transcriptional MerR regulator